MKQHRLVKATKADVATVRSWFSNDEDLEQWGGPGLNLDVPLDEFATQIKLDELHSFCLKDEQNDICGMGQFYVRLERHHFGRIAIAPHCRKQGLAYLLMALLAKEAPKHQSAKGYSLFVLEHNIPAIKTYQRLGFDFTPYPDDIPGNMSGCLYMVVESIRT